MKSNFKEMFENYLPEELLLYFSICDVKRLYLDDTNNIVRIEAEFYAIPELEYILIAEEKLSKAVLKRVRFVPHFSEQLFGVAALPYVFDELKFRGKTVNGFLNDAHTVLDDSKLKIFISHGGVEILSKIGCESEISLIVSQWFGVKLGVEMLEDPDNNEQERKDFLLYSGQPHFQKALTRPEKNDQKQSGQQLPYYVC